MDVIELIERLDRTVKSDLLGAETTKLLRWTFAKNDTGILPDDVLNQAVYQRCASYFVNNRRGRQLFAYCLHDSEIDEMRFPDRSSVVEFAGKASPRSFCERFGLALAHIGPSADDDRQPFELVGPTFGQEIRSKGSLHPYQLEMKLRLFNNYTGIAQRRTLCTMPTGSGKTATLNELLVDIIRCRLFPDTANFHFTWIVDSEILAEQSFKSFRSLWQQKGDREIRLNRFYANFEECHIPDVCSGTFATFTLAAVRLHPGDFTDHLRNCNLLIIDEAHASNANTYRQVVEKFLDLNPLGRVIGLTATPYRPDDAYTDSLRSMFDVVYQITDNGVDVASPINFLVNHGYLSRVVFHQLEVENALDFGEAYVKKLHESVVDVVREHILHRKRIIVFADSLDQAVCLKIVLDSFNLESALIFGDTPQITRDIFISRIANGNDSLSVLINHNILSKGVDIPGLNSIMILGNMSNPAHALQIIGRAMRGPKNGGNVMNSIYLTPTNFHYLSSYQSLESLINIR
jgi:superfamily II DNA or RNA helicase